MDVEDRRPYRPKRGSTHNESCGEGGNEPAEKPRLRKREETPLVRRPLKVHTKTPKPKESRYDMDPSKIREAKPQSMSLDDPVKMLEEFNALVNDTASVGLCIVDEAGGFSNIEMAQKEFFQLLKDSGEISPEMLESLILLDKEARRSHKYLKRIPIKYPKPGGKKFIYIYRYPKRKTETPREEEEEHVRRMRHLESIREAEAEAESSSGDSETVATEDLFRFKKYRPGMMFFNKKILHKLLDRGHYSLLSAGKNITDKKEAELPWDDATFMKRHRALEEDLKKSGFMFTPVFGKFGGNEFSFIVFHNTGLWKQSKASEEAQKSFMVHHQKVSEHQLMRDLAKKYNQQAVIHSRGQENELQYVSGKDAGKFQGGKGYSLAKGAKDYYTRVHLTKPPKKGETSKFALNFSGDLKDIAAAVHKALIQFSQSVS